MNETLPGFEAPQPTYPRPKGRLVEVQPDITSVSRSFTYEVPLAWEKDGRAVKVDVGSLVRIDFHGRRTAGWVTAVDVEFDPTVDVQPLSKWSSFGPPQDVVAVAEWAAWRWAGGLVHMLRAASPPKMVLSVPPVEQNPTSPSELRDQIAGVGELYGQGVTAVREPGRGDVLLALQAATEGNTLLLVPTIKWRRRLAGELRRAGLDVAEYPDQWSRSTTASVIVGTRTAAFAPIRDLSAVVVFDEHDAAYKSERTPSWNGRDVAIERSRRAGVPCLLVSPCLSLEALREADRILEPSKSAMRGAWPRVDVVDLRKQSTPGLLTPAIVDVIRGPGPVVCVLNRKGRARMLACARCGALAACESCGASLVELDDATLSCPRDDSTRPMVCAECAGTHLKYLRPGISRLAEDLAVLAKRKVLEVSAETSDTDLSGDVLILGTEAVLHRVENAAAVLFLDFDQELGSRRLRGAEDAFALLALAARMLSDQAQRGRLIIQTRRPDDDVVQSAMNTDPARLARRVRDDRRALSQPPYGAWAIVSGAGADEFVESAQRIVANEELAVRFLKRGDEWRLSSKTHEPLLEALHATARPESRTRIEVDPISV